MAGKIKFRSKEGGGDFTLVPAGTYDLQIVSIDPDATGKDGEPQVKIEFEIAGGTDYDGVKIPKWIGLDDKWGWQLRLICEAAGVDFEEIEEEEVGGKVVKTLEFDPDELLQRYVRAEVDHWTNDKKKQTYHNLKEFAPSPLQAQADGNASTAPASAPASAPSNGDPPRRRPRPAA